VIAAVMVSVIDFAVIAAVIAVVAASLLVVVSRP
jgi:hypothetical protein